MEVNRALIATGTAGAVLAVICRATPLLANTLAALGLTAWVSKADYLVIPALLICLGLLGVGLYRRMSVQVRRDPATPQQDKQS